ncbi:MULTISPECIES: Sec-independent protein translocase protein TatB [unclassified Pseudomonas]|uniref:Sec-independent protein translocase protein TatB n=1 Tax=unclassified Pseudomonas TaxID=196821 RepID=UPI000EDB6FB8|nr:MULTISPECIES: Sec-independent protein translocase protein TatB [Pseudomonas]MBH3341068.1 twin-arginine translocase subunit TatB [Pseudomonas mendocina]HBZ94161.1 twin-arginine translocase subunit TatB [Pseudomonas sp.]
MFEIGFTEMLLVGVVALLVLGPHRLPAAARTLGRGLGQAKRAMGMLRDQFEKELNAEALNKEFDAAPLRQLEQDLRRSVSLQPPTGNDIAKTENLERAS